MLNQTPFYAESGGQVGDTGMMTGEGVKFRVTDMQKKAGDLFVHVGTVEQGTLKAGTALQLEVDHIRRSSIRAHHSATHLLHEALRQVLGDHIAQRGSLVAPDRLRFDFVHPKPITPEELARVEDIANDVVLENDEVTTRLMAVDDAREAGARALFGEKYGDEVRVVSMGKQAREQGSNALGWSVELCGGTHVRRTGDIGLISVTGESAVASGVRRIEALTGRHARKHANDTMALAKTAARRTAHLARRVPARIAALMEERKKLERDLSDARKKLAMGGGASAATVAAAAGVREAGGVKLMARAVEGVETKDLKSLVDDGKKQIGSGVVAIVGVTEDGKAGVVVGVTPDLTSRFSAVDLVKIASATLGGKGGGGRPDMAQAGGPDGAKADAALSAIEKAMARLNAARAHDRYWLDRLCWLPPWLAQTRRTAISAGLSAMTASEKLRQFQSARSPEVFRDTRYVAYSDAAGITWTFTQAGNPAHPAVVCRRIVGPEGKLQLETNAGCDASRAGMRCHDGGVRETERGDAGSDEIAQVVRPQRAMDRQRERHVLRSLGASRFPGGLLILVGPRGPFPGFSHPVFPPLGVGLCFVKTPLRLGEACRSAIHFVPHQWRSGETIRDRALRALRHIASKEDRDRLPVLRK